MDYSPSGSSIHGILQTRILQWIAISFSRRSSWPRDWTSISYTGRWTVHHWATNLRPLFFPHKVDSHVYKLKLCPLGGLSSTTVFQTITKHGCHSAATFRLYLHTEPTHLWSKLKRFSPPSAAHTRLPIEPQVWAEGHGCNSLDLGGKERNLGHLLKYFACALCSSVLFVLDVTGSSYVFARPVQPCTSWVC